MNQSLGLVIFALIVAVVIVVLAVVNYRREQTMKRLAEISLQKGWQFVKSPSAYVDCILRGQDADVRWELRYTNREKTFNTFNRENVESIVWFSSAAGSRNGTIFVSPKMVEVPNLGGFDGVNTMAATFLNKMLRALGIDISGSSPQAVGSEAFQSKYLTLAPDDSTARQLIADIEAQLLRWSETNRLNMPSIVIDATGVTLRVVRNNLSVQSQCQMAEQMTSLGMTVVNAMR
ncbi:MAG: hypothetical protein ACOYYF_16435 [Chloroflexota bacterium]|nr:hypothetical protein [Chloroflexota bacterium]MBI5703957.1 hypothetical protein [Chloroflexota bacterium]